MKLWSPQSNIPDLSEDAPREPLMNDDEMSLWEIVMKNQVCNQLSTVFLGKDLKFQSIRSD